MNDLFEKLPLVHSCSLGRPVLLLVPQVFAFHPRLGHSKSKLLGEFTSTYEPPMQLIIWLHRELFQHLPRSTTNHDAVWEIRLCFTIIWIKQRSASWVVCLRSCRRGSFLFRPKVCWRTTHIATETEYSTQSHFVSSLILVLLDYQSKINN